MSRSQKDPLRPLTAEERQELTRLSRSLSARAAHVERARALPSAPERSRALPSAPERAPALPSAPERSRALPSAPERSRALPSALGHYGWRKLHGGRPPSRT